MGVALQEHRTLYKKNKNKKRYKIRTKYMIIRMGKPMQEYFFSFEFLKEMMETKGWVNMASMPKL